MSTHRELKNAQAALNERVAALLDVVPPEAWTGDDDHVPRLALSNLLAAYDEWDALRKRFDGDRPAVARDTSIAAAKTRPLKAASLRLRVVQAIVAHHKMYGTGLTTDQLEVRFKRSHQSVSSAVNDMDNKGWITDSKERRATRSGSKAIVWMPTPLAQSMIEGEAG